MVSITPVALFLPLPPATTPAERFANIIATLLAMVGARLERPGKPGLAGPLTLAIAIRLHRIRNRLTRYYARFQAGTLTPPRPRPAMSRSRTTPATPPLVVLPKLPRGRMWLVRLVPGIGVGTNYLRILLDDPEMAAMMLAAPQIARTLRPFWHMLADAPLPPILQRPRLAPTRPADAPQEGESGEGGAPARPFCSARPAAESGARPPPSPPPYPATCGPPIPG